MKAPDSAVQVRRVTFEPTRFEVAGDCCIVLGRWYGVRGRRFMRPALTVVVNGQSIRLLADLADKPWTAEEGEPWRATFPHTLGSAELHEAELTVAPDVTIALPAPERPGDTAKKKSSSRRAGASRERGVQRAGRSADDAFDRVDRPGRKSGASEAEREGGEAAALTRELAELREAHVRLRRQLDRLETDEPQIAQRLEEMSHRLREVTDERDEANTARARIAAELEAARTEQSELSSERDVAKRERDRMAADRQAAQRACDEALRAGEAAGAARDRALSERGGALAAQRQAVSERDAATAARAHAVSERDAALSLRDHALAERDAAVAALHEATSEREALTRTNERLQSELADLRSARGAALVMRRAAQAPAASRRYGGIAPGAIAIAVVFAVVLIVLIVLRVL